jgi:hypothetical protein
MEVLRLYKFVEKYFKNCRRLSRIMMKKELKAMRITLIHLKKRNPKPYEAIRREVVHEDNYVTITNIKSMLPASNANYIVKFYEGLRKEEQQSCIRSSDPR